MKYILKLRFPVERGNEAIADPAFGEKMKALLSEIKAEAAFFTTMCGERGGYIIVNMNDASEMPAKAEPFFLWLDASVDAVPVMQVEDLAKAGPSIGAAVQKWGKR